MNRSSGQQTLLDIAVEDCAKALVMSFDRLSAAANSANSLLLLAGFAGTKGDTADDLRMALAIHGHLLQQFLVKVRTAGHIDVYTLAAESSFSAYSAAVASQGDAPCGITVTPADTAKESSHAALADAHRALRVAGPLDAALRNPALSQALQTYARGRKRRPRAHTDFKRQAANDRD